MTELTEKQKKQARKDVDVESLDQHYFYVPDNTAEHENDTLTFRKGRLNQMIDKGDLIPFVPAYDL